MPDLNPQVLGQAENAHRAILGRILAGTGLSYHGWVAVRLIAAAGDAGADRKRLIDQMAGGLKISGSGARAAVDGLGAAGLLETLPDGPGRRIRLSAAGQEVYRRARGEIDRVMARMYGDIPPGDLATAGRVLTVLTDRANAELARA